MRTLIGLKSMLYQSTKHCQLNNGTQISQFFLQVFDNFDPKVLYDPEKHKENELFAALNMETIVNKSCVQTVRKLNVILSFP